MNKKRDDENGVEDLKKLSWMRMKLRKVETGKLEEVEVEEV